MITIRFISDMLQNLPQTITVTELQRNPRILDFINQKEREVVIIKGSKQIGVYTPMPVYKRQKIRLEEMQEINRPQDKDGKLQKDLKLITKLAGKVKIKMNYTPDELNKIFDESYEMLS